jgi:adenosylcobinamide kinase / adenosylcobinamide-phosphate guanylyltransferase
MVRETTQHKPKLQGVAAMPSKVILVGGGARSGKSRFALEYAKRLGQRRLFVATAEAFDAEMRERIQRHRDERGADFATVEEPLHLARLLGHANDVDVVVVDCLTLWLSNLLMQDVSVEQIDSHVAELVTVLQTRQQHVVLVSNEVGLGIVPESPLGRIFRDVAGRTHQRLAAEADEVYFAAMGLVLRLVPEPVKFFRPGQCP